MEEGSKRRLIGATVVVVLLVIFVPMLFEKKPQAPSTPAVTGTATPAAAHPQRDAEFRQPPKPAPLATITELPPPDLLTPKERGLAGQEVAAPLDRALPTQGTSKSAETPKTKEVPKTKEAPKTAAKEPPHDTHKEDDKETPKTSTAKVAPNGGAPSGAVKPTEPPPKKTGAGWVFQVASLNERDKADAMMANLKAKGFPAFVEEAEVNGRTYYRVRVGPRQERKDIDALAASVRDKTGQAGQVQRY